MARPPPHPAIPASVDESLAHCWGCGPKNPQGLRLAPRYEGDLTVVDWQPGPEHAGWETVIHGGVLAAFLDEVCAFGMFNGYLGFGMTRTLKVEYRRRVHWTKPLHAEARVVRRDEAASVVRAQLFQDGKVCTEAEAEFALMHGPPPRGA